MMRANRGLHADQARRHVGEPSLGLAARPFLPQDNGPALIQTDNVKRVLADIDANRGDHRSGFVGHDGAPSQPRRASRWQCTSTARQFH
jgi:hypothetical protein